MCHERCPSLVQYHSYNLVVLCLSDAVQSTLFYNAALCKAYCYCCMFSQPLKTRPRLFKRHQIHTSCILIPSCHARGYSLLRSHCGFCISKRSQLVVAVAKRTRKVIHERREGLIVSDKAKRKPVVQCHFWAVGRRTTECPSALDNILTTIDVKVLPNDPHSAHTVSGCWLNRVGDRLLVNLGMVYIKQGIGR